VEIYADGIQGRVVLPQFEHPPTLIERSEWLRELIITGADLPEDMSVFDRDALADSADAFSVMWRWGSGDPDLHQFADGMQRAAIRMDLLDPTNPGTLSTWIGDMDVLSSVRDHLLASRVYERTSGWLESLKTRFTVSAAETLLAALADVDAEDLVIDLDPDEPGTFYISEQSPGGTGHIESLTIALLEEPERLPIAIADVLRPNDMELLDEQLRSVISSGNATVRAAIDQLVRSWSGGHQAVQSATAQLDTALDAAGLTLSHAARTALTTRLAGPGASPTFLEEVQHWLVARDDAERSCGMEVRPRVLAALLAERSEADSFLHLEQPNERRRSRAIANVLWPWGSSVQSTGYFNPYVDRVGRSIETLRRQWRPSVQICEFSDWNDDRRVQVHDLLRSNGEVILKVPTASRRSLRAALLDLQVMPVEVGPLWCYPEVLGVHDLGQFVDARFVLRETW
jgi:hypothetical protein